MPGPISRSRSARVLAIIAVFLVTVSGANLRGVLPRQPAGRAVQSLIAQQADSLDASLAKVATAFAQSGATRNDEERRRLAFRQARVQYKRLEGVAEFYAPGLAAALNARRLESDDDDAPPPSAAVGFPALEELLRSPSNAARTDSALHLVTGMRTTTRQLRTMVPSLVPTAAQVLEIVRLELARVSTLGIAGFDAPRTGEAMRESAEAVEGVRVLAVAAGSSMWPSMNPEAGTLARELAAAESALRANPDFVSFDRLAYIAGPAQRAAVALQALRDAARVVPIRIPRAWRVNAPSVYGDEAFDAGAYAPSGTPAPSRELAALGRRLFFETSLSGSGARSCASCHRPDHGFTDGVPKHTSISLRGIPVARHTPTLLNAALQPAQFADERSVTLEDQVLEVLRSDAEMRSSDVRAAATLDRDAQYRTRFAAAFGVSPTNAVTPLRVRQALASFVRTLVRIDTRFDRAARGDSAALTAQERRGFTLFMGKAACGTCHFAPLFSGNTPPLYMKSDVEVLGTPHGAAVPGIPDADSGRAAIDHLPTHLRAFKTPTLRNLSGHGPYMHNGAYRTLDQVIRFYDNGGGRGAGARIDNQTLAPDSLHLAPAERLALLAFLGSLSSPDTR